MKRILVIGATGQIGTELVPELRRLYGNDNVVAGYHSKPPTGKLTEGPVEQVDVLNKESIEKVIKKYDINEVYHMAAILSAAGEKNPQLAWKVNMDGLYIVLELAREYGFRIFWPSSIAAFGPNSPKVNTPQVTIMDPTTMYGITKYAGELLTRYYAYKFGVDVRGVRYPGIISSEALPGGGTTDYAVEIFYYALEGKKYRCYLREDTMLPMMYMPDAVKAAIQLMNADRSKLTIMSGYNIAAFSFTPKQLELEIRKYIPEFQVEYVPDFRQKIADSWPKSLDDTVARKEWGWSPDWSFEAMVKDMLVKLAHRLGKTEVLERIK
ncbi:NAD-dependent epimerase/dehydratase family protein [Thermosphaera aggregans]|jgi:nucleoside-diphosphate-sugar epimerase|uniref:NAD-dependent epimerase/dehydratase n=1 Tax=Thermosphaera aggregans (strain DSM 11486 / M11TL) TaxID=633148 RepID=D5U2L3_THEAM|nr:NAD-dependent epimerase/dehydratase family protein [Thermosphaera aggregans]ADG91363.1 NAD-dependent epimerase/dehydratase [Thermosphaera aggregans DSM 11486]